MFTSGGNVAASRPVECLGIKFPNDDARRKYFLEKLKEKLKDPELRKDKGFPIGEDEDILAMSDPPYYTACPNPFIQDFLGTISATHQIPSNGKKLASEPYTEDVAESRNSPFINAHSYATKVPPQAVMHYLLHYTNPNDIVLDAFGGTGMTAVAAQLCDRPPDDLRLEFEKKSKEQGRSKPEWGPRPVIVSDLSPAATYFGSILTGNDDLEEFQNEARQLAEKVEEELGWMYRTRHGGNNVGHIHCTIWSDVFICPECSKEIVFWNSAVDLTAGRILDEFQCKHCKALVGKRGLERAFIKKNDFALQKTVSLPKQVPVLIVYHVDGHKYEKEPDKYDLELIQKIENDPIPDPFPVVPMMQKSGKWGDTWRSGYHAGITHLHHFYTTRNLRALACAWKSARSRRLRFMLTSLMYKTSLMCSPLMSNFFAERQGVNRGGWVGKERSGTLFRGSIMSEVPVVPQIRTRLSSVAISARTNDSLLIQTCSAGSTRLPDDSIDYIFIDPPFGENRIYSELNFFWEAWHRVYTRQEEEAIVSSSQKKGLYEYQQMMLAAFRECYRVLRPGKWMTVEFSNTSAAVWNAIQTAISEGGFVVADVRSLDKQQGSINAYTTPTAVKQDLVISAYKPTVELARAWKIEAGSEGGAWKVVEEHLRHLPITVVQGTKIEPIPARQRHQIYDQVVAFHVQQGVAVPYSAGEFYQRLQERYPEREGMYFLPEQVPLFDKKRLLYQAISQPSLFIFDEATSVQWLRHELSNRPQSRQDLHKSFMQAITQWQKHERTSELDDLLEQNFLCYTGQGEVPSQIHSYLSSNYKELRGLEKNNPRLIEKAKNRWFVPDARKEADLEQLRHKALMRDFRQYIESKGKLKLIRSEALRAGFKECWQNQDYLTIVQMAKRVPETVIQEDPALLMYFDNALMRSGE
jgi:DNA modification methylase